MPPAPALPGPRLALVVTASAYTDPGLARLRAPARDANDMIEVPGDPAIGGFSLTTLTDQPEAAVRRAVERFLAGRSLDDARGSVSTTAVVEGLRNGDARTIVSVGTDATIRIWEQGR